MKTYEIQTQHSCTSARESHKDHRAQMRVKVTHVKPIILDRSRFKPNFRSRMIDTCKAKPKSTTIVESWCACDLISSSVDISRFHLKYIFLWLYDLLFLFLIERIRWADVFCLCHFLCRCWNNPWLNSTKLNDYSPFESKSVSRKTIVWHIS